MQDSRKRLLFALALIAGGVIAFLAYLAVMGIDPDVRPLGMSEWIVAGLLIGPGFGCLVRWSRQHCSPANRTGAQQSSRASS